MGEKEKKRRMVQGTKEVKLMREQGRKKKK